MASLPFQVREDLGGCGGVEDEGEDAHLAATLLADQWVDFVDTAQEASPQPAQTAAFRRVGLNIGSGTAIAR